MSLRVVRNLLLSDTYHLIDLALPQEVKLAGIVPGQFVQVAVPHERYLLRRPISICDIDHSERSLRLLVAPVGTGTKQICSVKEGDCLDVVFPLGHGFSLPDSSEARPLLIGGGVGIAPLLYQARKLYASGIKPTVLLGAREKRFLKLSDEFAPFCDLILCTDDGSLGCKGFVTQASLWSKFDFTHVYVCGPMPMMINLAKLLKDKKADVEFSLENMMACGVGACLCCVEKTVEGHKCVCTDGPVFKLDRLTWLDN